MSNLRLNEIGIRGSYCSFILALAQFVKMRGNFPDVGIILPVQQKNQQPRDFNQAFVYFFSLRPPPIRANTSSRPRRQAFSNGFSGKKRKPRRGNIIIFASMQLLIKLRSKGMR